MNTSSNSWSQLLYQGLQAGGAAFIVSAALSQAARGLIIHYARGQAQIDLTLGTLVAGWLLLGLLCLAPLTWVLKRRLQGMFGLSGGYRLDNPTHVWKCRQAASFSLFASPLWWLAPALIQSSGH